MPPCCRVPQIIDPGEVYPLRETALLFWRGMNQAEACPSEVSRDLHDASRELFLSGLRSVEVYRLTRQRATTAAGAIPAGKGFTE